MAVGIPAQLQRLNERARQLESRVRDVEDVQLSQLRKTAELERKLQVILLCLQRLQTRSRRHDERAEAALRAALEAISPEPERPRRR